jgi:putative ABC transport system permease protein
VLNELRLAVRSLRNNPGVTAAAVLTLALGVGANTAIFSTVDAVLFRPLPFHDDGRLVLVGEGLPMVSTKNFGTISDPDYLDYQQLDGSVFESSAAFEGTAATLTGNGTPERLAGLETSPSLLHVLGMRPALGRDFEPADGVVGAPDVVLLSDALWRRRFGGDRSVIGRAVVLDGQPATVVGVLPPQLVFPLPGLGPDPAEFFEPFRVTPFRIQHRGDSFDAFMVARLAAGVPLTRARAAVNAIASGLPAKYPDVFGSSVRIVGDAFPLRDRAVAGVRGSLLLLLGAVACVLVIACINVSALLLAKGAAREREAAVRTALGASRGRLARQFLAEGAVLAAGGAALGLLVARWGTAALGALAPGDVLSGYAIGLDGRVLAFTLLTATLVALAFSLVPVLRRTHGTLPMQLREEGRGASAGRERQRGRRALVVAELALALVVVTSAGLLLRSFVNARRVDPGFVPEHVLSFQTALPAYRYPNTAAVLRTEQHLVDGLRSIPGVTDAAAGMDLPMAAYWHALIAPEGVPLPQSPLTVNNLVLPGYFHALGIELVQGRTFTADDRTGSRPVAIVDEGFARRFFPGTSAIGRRIKWGAPTGADPWKTIVGLVRTVKARSLDEESEPETYFPALQYEQDSSFVGQALRTLRYVVRTSADPRAVMGEVRGVVREVDPELPLTDVATGLALVTDSLARRRFELALLGAFAALALVLAVVGVYGLIAYSVVQRHRELGVRLALGATPREVVQLVLTEGAGTAAAGATIGIVGAVIAARLMRGLLFGIGALDGVTFAAATLLLIGIGLLATWVPARRAARVDPIEALRHE